MPSNVPILVIIGQVLALLYIPSCKYPYSRFTIDPPEEMVCIRSWWLLRIKKYNRKMGTGGQPFLHLGIWGTTMIYISWFISFVCGINHHVSVNLTQVKVCFSLTLHSPKPFLTCFVINNCIRGKIGKANIILTSDSKLAEKSGPLYSWMGWWLVGEWGNWVELIKKVINRSKSIFNTYNLLNRFIQRFRKLL